MGTGILLAASSYTRAITNLKSVLLTLGSAIGAVMLVYGGIKFAMAFRQMDQQGEHQAVYSVVAGGVLVGLSALMTTTLVSMEKTIELLRKSGHECKVMVGGAVLTPDYALKIGADYYAKDAKESVDIAKKVLG